MRSENLRPVAKVDVLILHDEEMGMTTKFGCQILECPDDKKEEATAEVTCLAFLTLAGYLNRHHAMSAFALHQLVRTAIVKNKEDLG